METLLHIGLSNTLLATGLAVLAAVVGAVTRRPALAHGLWLLVLLKLVTPPFVHLPILPTAAPAPPMEPTAGEEAVLLTPEELQQFFQESQAAEATALEAPALQEPPSAAGPTAAEEAPSIWTPNWQAALGGLWLAGSVGWFLLAAYRVGRFRHLLHHAQPVPPELRAEIRTLAKRLGLRHCPEVRFVPGPVSPMLWSMGGPPLLLLPMELWERLTEEQRQTLAVHELAHLARRDHWVRGLELLATGLYWWNPVVWWARHGLREAEERCCDAWVVWALPTAARAYATALMETVDFLSEARPVLPAAASGIGHVRILKRRLTMILQGTTPRALSATGYLALAALAALLLPLLPTWAQEPPAPPMAPAPAEKKIRVQFEDRQADMAAFQLGQLLLELQAQKAAGEDAAEIDQVIAELKKKLAELEAKRAREKAKATVENKKKAGEIEKAHAEVRKLAEEAQKKEAEAMAARAKLHSAMEKLAQLDGGKNLLFQLRVKTGEPLDGGQKFLFMRGDPVSGGNITIRKVPGEGNPPVISIRKGPAEGNPSMILWKQRVADPRSSEDRLQRLEKQLGELLREVKELRKETKKPGEPRGDAEPPKSPPGVIIRSQRNPAVSAPPVAPAPR